MSMSAPHLLHLVATQREVEACGVLDDESCEGHGQVEVQGEGVVISCIRVEAADGVDLLVDLALAQEHIDWLDTACLQWGEAVEFEDPAHRVENLEFHQSPLGQPLGKAG